MRPLPKHPGLLLAYVAGASVRVAIEVAPLALFVYVLWAYAPHTLSALAWCTAFVVALVVRDAVKK